MIIDKILQFFGTIVDWILDLLPPFTELLPQSRIENAVGHITHYNSLLPVSELYWCMSISGIIFGVMIGYYVIMWVVKRLTFSG